MSADLETRIRRDVVVTDAVEVEARRQRNARNRLAVVQALGITAVVAGPFAGLYAMGVEVDQMRRRTRQIEASLVAEPTEVAKPETKKPHYYVDDYGKLWDYRARRLRVVVA